jgi:uncharacterized protein (DUF427 family)
MSLMLGTGPFGQHPAGSFNREMPERRGLILFEDSPRRIRGVLAGETVVDSTRSKLLHEHGHLPIYYFPREDVRVDLLEPTDHHTRCPWKGEASYWSVRVGDRLAENAVWGYPEPLDDAPPLAGYVAFYWNKFDTWYEEDEEAIVHPRDPYHRVDVVRSSRHVVVRLGGEVIAESTRPLALFETGLPTRWYLPEADVRMDLLEPSDKRTGCAYKGFASYWSVGSGDELEEDVVWTYREPRRGMEDIKDLVCFFNERVDLEVDGELEERPETQWSPRHARSH